MYSWFCYIFYFILAILVLIGTGFTHSIILRSRGIDGSEKEKMLSVTLSLCVLVGVIFDISRYLHVRAHRVIVKKRPEAPQKISCATQKLPELSKKEFNTVLENFEDLTPSCDLEFDQSRQRMTRWKVFKKTAEYFNKHYAVHDGVWYRVSKMRHEMVALLGYCAVYGASILAVALVKVPDDKRKENSFTAAIVNDYLNSFSLTVLALLALLSFMGFSSVKQLRTTGRKVRYLPLEECKKLSLLAANTNYQVRGIDATNACFAFHPESGETNGFVPVPAGAVWRPVKVSGDGTFRREAVDGKPTQTRKFYLWGETKSAQEVPSYVSKLGYSMEV